MVDLISPISRRTADVWRLQPWLASFMCMAVLSTGAAARGEKSGTTSVAPDASNSELQQPGHILPEPDSAAKLDPKTAGAIAGPTPKPLRQPIGNVRPVPKFNPTPYYRMRLQNRVRQMNFQTSGESTASTAPQAPAAPNDPESTNDPESKERDPCESLVDRPFSEFGINTAMSGDQFPDDHAAECWSPINEGAGPFVGARSWGATTFAWNATCFCHRPLYFEEINLERYGYGCCESLQPAASAAHFFATIPALPYCIATDCPGDCIYTLGHYRPGNCNPWQCHWPRFTTRAGLAEGGVWTGLVFLIP